MLGFTMVFIKKKERSVTSTVIVNICSQHDKMYATGIKRVVEATFRARLL